MNEEEVQKREKQKLERKRKKASQQSSLKRKTPTFFFNNNSPKQSEATATDYIKPTPPVSAILPQDSSFLPDKEECQNGDNLALDLSIISGKNKEPTEKPTSSTSLLESGYHLPPAEFSDTFKIDRILSPKTMCQYPISPNFLIGSALAEGGNSSVNVSPYLNNYSFGVNDILNRANLISSPNNYAITSLYQPSAFTTNYAKLYQRYHLHLNALSGRFLPK